MAHAKLCEKYFDEYKKAIYGDPSCEQLLQEMKKFQEGDRIIRTLDRKGQAAYADYVTKKMCENESIDHIVSMARESIARLSYDKTTVLNSAAIGGMALMVETLKGHSKHDLAKSLETSLDAKLQN